MLSGRGPSAGAPDARAATVVREVAGDRPVLAVEPLAETLARDGVRVWAANPIDAFPREVQADLLDFLHDGTVPDAADVEVVVLGSDRAADLVSGGGWRVVREVDDLSVLERLPSDAQPDRVHRAQSSAAAERVQPAAPARARSSGSPTRMTTAPTSCARAYAGQPGRAAVRSS